MMYFVDLLIKFGKAHPFLVLLNSSFMLLFPVSKVLLPHIFAKLLGAFEERDSGSLKIYIILVLFILISVQIGWAANDWHDTLLIPQLESFLRESMIQKTILNYTNRFYDISTGDFISRLIRSRKRPIPRMG